MSTLLRLRAVAVGIRAAKWTSAFHASAAASGWQSEQRQTKAVIFDMGGVIVPSPLPFIFDYEKRLGLPGGTINKVVVKSGLSGSWAQLERGEISVDEFGRKFSDECSTEFGKRVDLTQLLVEMERLPVTPCPEMIDAVQCLRAEGIKTALLTNNFYLPSGLYLPVDTSLFDVVVESAKVRMRKPEERIYRHTLELLNVQPEEAVFLDDMGINLKTAKDLGLKTVKVSDAQQGVRDLEDLVGFCLRGYIRGTSLVPKKLQISVENLKSYLDQTLNLSDRDEPIVRCFEHGQSNPTYSIVYAGKKLVLRKKPPGKLLPSAHAIEREYRVMKAIGSQGVPVPKMLCLCEDDSVLGTPFYIMEYVNGRIFKDPALPGLSPDERRQVFSAATDILSRIHKVNIKEAGLEDYGKAGEYLKRNFARWSKQYEASKTGSLETMDQLTSWLSNNLPEKEMITLVHGDYRVDNLIFHPETTEVLAVIDWELSTIGDPFTDLATSSIMYYLPQDLPVVPTLGGRDLKALGIPTVEEYVSEYVRRMSIAPIDNWNFYVAYTFFRFAAIAQGVYKRFTLGQSSSPTSEYAGHAAKLLAQIGLDIASRSPLIRKPTLSGPQSNDGKRSYSTSARSNQELTSCLPLSVAALSPRVQDLHRRVKNFVNENIIPLEPEFLRWSSDPKTKWTIHPQMEQLKAKAKSEGLWNLFLPVESDRDVKYGAGLTNVEYAFLAEEMGRSVYGSEPFNCSAPDTGNMEVLVRYGTEEQKHKWLRPLLDGEIRSCFAMTEPEVASSDATNIRASIRRDGNEYIVNGRKWWTSGATDPRCKVCIFMGKTDESAVVHRQQSMIIVPMDAPGVKILRPLTVYGFDDAPHGHAEVLFENVRVPVDNILLGEGRGFEIAQGRLGPGRIHHCMRTIGSAERALELMIERVNANPGVGATGPQPAMGRRPIVEADVSHLLVRFVSILERYSLQATITNRVAFGKLLAEQGSIQQDVARSRIEIEQGRLLVLKSAHMMDTVGNKVAAAEIAMIKAAIPRMATVVVDRAIQAHGGLGYCQDTPLPFFYMWARVLRTADGPDEVHLRSIAKAEVRRKRSLSKL